MARTRRDLRIIVAVLTLLLQLAAPVWAAWFFVHPALPAELPICAEHQPESDGKAPVHQHLIVCPLCVIVSQAFYAAPSAAAAIAAPVAFDFVVHETPQAGAPRRPLFRTANARAPPIRL